MEEKKYMLARDRILCGEKNTLYSVYNLTINYFKLAFYDKNYYKKSN